MGFVVKILKFDQLAAKLYITANSTGVGGALSCVDESAFDVKWDGWKGD